MQFAYIVSTWTCEGADGKEAGGEEWRTTGGDDDDDAGPVPFRSIGPFGWVCGRFFSRARKHLCVIALKKKSSLQRNADYATRRIRNKNKENMEKEGKERY